MKSERPCSDTENALQQAKLLSPSPELKSRVLSAARSVWHTERRPTHLLWGQVWRLAAGPLAAAALLMCMSHMISGRLLRPYTDPATGSDRAACVATAAVGTGEQRLALDDMFLRRACLCRRASRDRRSSEAFIEWRARLKNTGGCS